jgi:uncharacterized protein
MLRRLLLASAVLFAAADIAYFNDHAADRVKWLPWGKAAFDRARKEDKPVALVVGSFGPHSSRTAHAAIESDPAIVSSLNGRFVPVLLDRAEWPAIAAAYAAASDRADSFDVVMYAITPDQEWLDVVTPSAAALDTIADRWKSDRHAYLEDARLKVRRLRAQLSLPSTGKPPVDPALLVRNGNRDQAMEALQALQRSVRHDLLGGGFFRAVRDPEHPFFDKNLTDQARLAAIYLEAAQRFDNTPFAEVARNAMEFAVRDLQVRTGAFDDSQKADSLVPIGGPVIVDGAYYLWTRSEIMNVFGPKIGAQLCERFGVTTDERTLLRSVKTTAPDAQLAAAIAKMVEIRIHRPMPPRDEPILESSALMISALARGGAVLADDRYLRAATLGLTFIERTLFDRKTGQLSRRRAVPATAGDYTALVQACIDVYQVTLDPKWLDLAFDMQARQDVLFWNANANRYEGGSEVPEPVRAFVFAPEAMAPLNARAATNLLRLSAISGRDELRQRAEAISSAFQSLNTPEMAMLRLTIAAPVTRVIVFGMTYRADTTTLIHAAQPSFDPMRILVNGGDAKHPPSRNVRIGSLLPAADGTPSVYVCRSAGCSDALTTPDALASALK